MSNLVSYVTLQHKQMSLLNRLRDIEGSRLLDGWTDKTNNIQTVRSLNEINN